MARLTPEQYAEKWARRLSGSTADIKAGIERTTTAPGQAAVRKKDKLLARVTEKINDGTWERNVGAVTLEDWKRAATDKGLARISQGVESAKPSQAAMATRLLAAVDQGVAKVNGMPDNNLEDSIARSAAFQRHMAGAKIK